MSLMLVAAQVDVHQAGNELAFLGVFIVFNALYQ